MKIDVFTLKNVQSPLLQLERLRGIKGTDERRFLQSFMVCIKALADLWRRRIYFVDKIYRPLIRDGENFVQ